MNYTKTYFSELLNQEVEVSLTNITYTVETDDSGYKYPYIEDYKISVYLIDDEKTILEKDFQDGLIEEISDFVKKEEDNIFKINAEY